MVPKVTPRKRWLLSFTQSKKAEMPRASIFSSSICCISSHVELSTSHISDVIAPLSGEVLEVNQKVVDAPETVNEDPYGEGWLMRMRPAPGALTGAALLSAADYQKVLEAEGG